MRRLNRQKKKTAPWLAVGIFCLAGASAWAGEGTTGMDFIRLLPGARSSGLAGTYLAIGGDAESLYSNPAGIAGLLSPQIGLSHLAYWEGITYDALWAAQPVGCNQFAGLSFAYFNLPPFNSTADNLQPSAQAQGLLGIAGYAVKIPHVLAAGSGLKYAMSRLSQDQASAVALDLGIQYFALNDQLLLAAVARNLGFTTAFVEFRDAMPMEAGVGVAYQFWPDERYHLILAVDVMAPLQGKWTATTGLEFWYQQLLAVRCGVKKDNDVGDWLALGMGLRWQRLHVDYAVSPLSPMGIVHRVSVGYDFGNQRRPARPKLELALTTRQSVDAGGRVVRTVHLFPKASAPAGLDQWELVIEDAHSRILRKYSGAKTVPTEIVWEGADDQGRPMDAEGYYSYRMRISDQPGYAASCSGEILPASITRLPKLKALPRDMHAGRVGFTPREGQDLKAWEFKVMSPDGRLVKKYSGFGPIPKDLSWNGRDEQNRPVAVSKDFYFIVRCKDRQGNESVSKAPLIVVAAGCKAKTSQDMALNEEVKFSFQSPRDTKLKEWSLGILGQETGQIVKSFNGLGPMPEEVVWDSRDERGRTVPSQKEYGYILRFQDAAGNVWQQAQPIRSVPVQTAAATAALLTLKVEGILFDFNRAELKPEMFEKITEAAKLAKAHKGGNVGLLIEGHTDETGTDQYNLELSYQRAKMVMRFLVEEQGLSSAAITLKGYGKTRPLSNDQNQNRRVEISLHLAR